MGNAPVANYVGALSCRRVAHPTGTNSSPHAAPFVRFLCPVRHLRLAGGRLRFDSAQLVGEPDARFSQLAGKVVKCASGLDVRRVSAGHRAMQSVLRPMDIDPMPDRGGIALGAGDIDGAAVAIAAGRVAATVLGVAAMRFESGCEGLS